MNMSANSKKSNTFRSGISLAALLAAAGLVACTNSQPQSQQQDDQHLQQQAEKATEQVKADAKVAAAEAKVATANAGRQLKDIAKGVRQGLHNGSDNAGSDSASGNTGAGDGKPSAGRIDINSASQDELAALPGVSSSKAQEIINARPYGSSHDLVAKGVMSESRYERIARRITAR